MKKVLLSSLFVAGTLFTSGFFAQSIESNAKKAAKDAGCLADYNGSLDYSIIEIGICRYPCGPACDGLATLSEVYIFPNPNNHIGPYVKLAPLAKVTMCGNDEVVSVECL
ncbi:MAG: hypothetical protein K0R65_339 [Crocinitomicaceae bacterium]|jgi:hypothetical protein|nr:hypothetical protein [Crocinitomicaceae bacterium]